MYMYVCMYNIMYVCMYMNVCICTCMYVYMYVCMRMHAIYYIYTLCIVLIQLDCPS